VKACEETSAEEDTAYETDDEEVTFNLSSAHINERKVNPLGVKRVKGTTKPAITLGIPQLVSSPSVDISPSFGADMLLSSSGNEVPSTHNTSLPLHQRPFSDVTDNLHPPKQRAGRSNPKPKNRQASHRHQLGTQCIRSEDFSATPLQSTIDGRSFTCTSEDDIDALPRSNRSRPTAFDFAATQEQAEFIFSTTDTLFSVTSYC
jgi:hypothetical protein